MDSGYYKRLAEIESGSDPYAKNPNSSAKGLFQFIDGTGAQYGLDKAQFGTPEYTQAEYDAVQKFTGDNVNYLSKKLGRDLTPGEMYLAHQQGAGGAVKLLSNPNGRAVDTVGMDAIKLNGGDENMTNQDFANKWVTKFEGGQGKEVMAGGQGDDQIIDYDSMSPEQLAEIAGITLPTQEVDYDAMSPEQLAEIAGVELPKQNTKLQSAGYGLSDGASFGLDDEMRGFGGAAGQWLGEKIGTRSDSGMDFGDMRDYHTQRIRDEHTQAREDNPWSYGGGQVAAAIGGGAAIGKGLSSVAKLQKYARANKYKTAVGSGGVQGGVYGFNSGEGGFKERVEAGGVGGMLGAAAGPVGARVAQTAGNVLKPVANQVSKRLSSNQVAQQASKQIDDVIPENKFGEALPMSQGQYTQNPARQSLETGARKGAYGDKSQALMMQADNQQQDAIRQAVGNIGSGSDDNLIGAGKQVQRAYKSSKSQVNNAYDKARSTQGVYVNKTPIAEQFAPNVKGMLKDGGFDVGDLSPNGQKIIKSLDSDTLKNKDITAVNLEKMEFWRRKVSNNIADNTDAMGKVSPEGVAMKRVLQEYDTFMAKLPEDALKSGDEGALQAINKARGLRRKQGVLFERDKVVNKIVNSQDLTDEELANMVLTGAARSEKINTGSGRLVRNLKRAVGDNAPELQDGIKRGTLARMLQRGTTTATKSDTGERMISPAKLRNEFDGLVKNKTFLKEVFSPEEIEEIGKIHRDLIKISSEQAGTNNYSNTAYQLMRFVNIVPFGKASVGDALQGLGNRSTAKDIKKGLAPVLDGMINELTAQRRFYGATATAPISNKIQNSYED